MRAGAARAAHHHLHDAGLHRRADPSLPRHPAHGRCPGAGGGRVHGSEDAPMVRGGALDPARGDPGREDTRQSDVCSMLSEDVYLTRRGRVEFPHAGPELRCFLPRPEQGRAYRRVLPPRRRGHPEGRGGAGDHRPRPRPVPARLQSRPALGVTARPGVALLALRHPADDGGAAGGRAARRRGPQAEAEGPGGAARVPRAAVARDGAGAGSRLG